MTNIQTAAFNCDKKKLKKEQAQAILEHAYNTKSPISDNDLVSLFKLFKLASPKIAKTLEQWVFKAVSKDQYRPYLHLSYSDGEYLVATDGRRLHMTKTGLDAGYYDMNSNPIEWDFNFPEYKRVLPNIEVMEKRLLIRKDFVLQDNTHVLIHDIKFNLSYIEDALNGADNVDMYVTDDKSPIVLDMGDRQAVVMPVSKGNIR